MKTTLVIILGLCAAMATSEASLDSSLGWENLDLQMDNTQNYKKLGLLSEFVEGLFEKIKNSTQKNINFIQVELNKITQHLISEIILVSELSLMNAESIVRDAKAKMITSNDNENDACYEKYNPKLDNAIVKGQEKIEDCIHDANGKMVFLEGNVQLFIDALTNEISNIFNIVRKCSNIFRPFSTAECLFTNVEQVAGSISNITTNAYKALYDATEDFHDIVLNARTCITTSANSTEIEVENIGKFVDVCLN